MLRIQRLKTTTDRAGQATTATHFASAVLPSGQIERWAADPAQAVAVTEAVALRVRKFYAQAKNVGVLRFEPVSATGAQLAQAVAADDGVGAAEFEALQADYRALAAERDDLRARLAEATRPAPAAPDLRDRVAELEAQLIAASERNAALAAQVADLEAHLAVLPAEEAPDGAEANGKVRPRKK